MKIETTVQHRTENQAKKTRARTAGRVRFKKNDPLAGIDILGLSKIETSDYKKVENEIIPYEKQMRYPGVPEVLFQTKDVIKESETIYKKTLNMIKDSTSTNETMLN